MKSHYETKYYFYLHDIPFLPLAIISESIWKKLQELAKKKTEVQVILLNI